MITVLFMIERKIGYSDLKLTMRAVKFVFLAGCRMIPAIKHVGYQRKAESWESKHGKGLSRVLANQTNGASRDCFFGCENSTARANEIYPSDRKP